MFEDVILQKLEELVKYTALASMAGMYGESAEYHEVFQRDGATGNYVFRLRYYGDGGGAFEVSEDGTDDFIYYGHFSLSRDGRYHVTVHRHRIEITGEVRT